MSILLFVDADACPVKQEIYRVTERFVRRGTALKIIVVSNSPIAVPRDDFIERVVVGAGMDEADNYIAERAGPGSVVITADVPFAAADRSRFLSTLDAALMRLTRAGFGQM